MTMKEVYQPFVSHPNQLIGKIHKPSDYKKRYNQEGKKYMLVGIDEIREAAINLTPSAFKLYLYFVENENDWQFFLSPKDFQKAYGVAESTFRNAKKELIEKNILSREIRIILIFTLHHKTILIKKLQLKSLIKLEVSQQTKALILQYIRKNFLRLNPF